MTMTATSPLSCKHERATHDDGDAARDGPPTHRDDGESSIVDRRRCTNVRRSRSSTISSNPTRRGGVDDMA
jgi:hypothetical protein